MSRLKALIKNRHESRELYMPWLWPKIFFVALTRPVPPAVCFMNFIFQRIFRINAKVKFQVHYTSSVTGKISLGTGVKVSFAVSGNCYVQGDNGIKIGDNTIFAPGVKIISANHDPNDFSKQVTERPVIIGKNCWIATNAVILPGVELGDNVIVGAGTVVTKSFPDNVVIAGTPAKIIKQR